MTDDINEIREYLRSNQDMGYRELQIRTIPNIRPDKIIGVRTPVLRAYAKGISSGYLDMLPHMYFEEDQLHAFVISGIKDFDRCISEVDRFLPYVDNWATCDQMSPKVFAKHRPQLMDHIRRWITSDRTYMVRFAVKMLMDHFLDDDFDPKYPEMVLKVRSDEYYIQMMVAWYFATALAKQYDKVIYVMEEHKLDKAVHKRTVRKCTDSFRISDDHKKYLRSL